ncbi:hypothetical protein ACWDTD_17680 [Gordonia sp. NPDC003425]
MQTDSAVYYAAGRGCREIASNISAQVGLLRTSLLTCGGMGGDHPNASQWCGQYDQRAIDFVKNAENLVNALENLGDVTNVAGYNWAIADYRANSDPHKGAEPVCPARSRGAMYEGPTLHPPTSVGANGSGYDTDIPNLLEKIGVPVPNGDSDKLAKASRAWNAFATHDHIANAGTALGKLHDSFTDLETADTPLLQGHLATVSAAASALRAYASEMASPIDDHHRALGEMRSKIKVRSDELLAEIASTVIVAAVVFVGLIVVTGGAAAGGAAVAAEGGAAATATLIARAGLAIRSLITTSRLLTVVLGAGTASAAAFAKASGLTPAASLEHIAMLVAQTDDDNDPRYVPSPKHDPSTPDHGRRGTPMDLSDEEAQQVLDESIASGRRRYGTSDDRLYEFKDDNAGGWHGYPVTPQEIPNSVLKKMMEDGLITKRQYRKWLH